MVTFPDMVRAELARARQLHPGAQHSAHEGYAVLLEEVDEFWREVCKRKSHRDPGAMLKELVQIGSMAQRTAEDLGLLP